MLETGVTLACLGTFRHDDTAGQHLAGGILNETGNEIVSATCIERGSESENENVIVSEGEGEVKGSKGKEKQELR